MTKGEAIKFVRKARRVRQIALADKVGITQPYLSQVESSLKENPSEDLVEKIAKELNIDPCVFSILTLPATAESYGNKIFASEVGMMQIQSLKLWVCAAYGLPSEQFINQVTA